MPVIVGPHLARLKQNAFTDFTAKTHEYTIVGTLRLAINVDTGLDMNHEANCLALATNEGWYLVVT